MCIFCFTMSWCYSWDHESCVLGYHGVDRLSLETNHHHSTISHLFEGTQPHIFHPRQNLFSVVRNCVWGQENNLETNNNPTNSYFLACPNDITLELLIEPKITFSLMAQCLNVEIFQCFFNFMCKQFWKQNMLTA